MLVEQMLDGAHVRPADLPDEQEPEPLHPQWETQDIALEYIEGEVGRFDWERNWKDHRASNGNRLRERVQSWLQHYEIDHDPQAIIDYIDNELMMRPGKWL